MITKALDNETEEVVGVKCRLCDAVIMDEMTAQQLLMYGAKSGKDPVMGALALLTMPLLVCGGFHMLSCTRKKLN